MTKVWSTAGSVRRLESIDSGLLESHLVKFLVKSVRSSRTPGESVLELSLPPICVCVCVCVRVDLYMYVCMYVCIYESGGAGKACRCDRGR